MRPVFLSGALLFSLSSSSASQFLPVSLSSRLPPGCQYPSATEGTYIYFTHPDEPFYYSISTPWTRFYPDALRADLAEQRFEIGVQHGETDNDMCGWTTVDTVKDKGWLRGKVSYRKIPSGGVKVSKAPNGKHPGNTSIPLNPHLDRAALTRVNNDLSPGKTVHFVNHTRRAGLTAEQLITDALDIPDLHLTRPVHGNTTGLVISNGLPGLDDPPDVDLPDVDLPGVEIPDIELPDIDPPEVDSQSELHHILPNATQYSPYVKVRPASFTDVPVRREEQLEQGALTYESSGCSCKHKGANITNHDTDIPSCDCQNCPLKKRDGDCEF